MKLIRHNCSGFTLVELLIASVLTGIVTFAALRIYLTQHQQFIVQEQVSDMQYRGRIVLDELAFNLRQCGFGTPQGVDAYSIAANPNGPDTLRINHHGSDIIYFVDETDSLHPNLIKDVDGVPEIFAHNMEGLEITVLSSNLVQVEVVARSSSIDEATVKDYRRRTYTTRVKLRNQ